MALNTVYPPFLFDFILEKIATRPRGRCGRAKSKRAQRLLCSRRQPLLAGSIHLGADLQQDPAGVLFLGERDAARCVMLFFYPLIFFDFIQWKPTDTWPRDRCGRAQLVLLPSLADFLHLGADLQIPQSGRIGLTQSIRMPAVTSGYGVGECASPG